MTFCSSTVKKIEKCSLLCQLRGTGECTKVFKLEIDFLSSVEGSGTILLLQ